MKIAISGYQSDKVSYALITRIEAKKIQIIEELYEAFEKIESVRDLFYDIGLDDQQISDIRLKIKHLIDDIKHIYIEKEE